MHRLVLLLSRLDLLACLMRKICVRTARRPGLQAQPRMTDVELRNMQTRSLSLADKLTLASAALKTNLNALI